MIGINQINAQSLINEKKGCLDMKMFLGFVISGLIVLWSPVSVLADEVVCGDDVLFINAKRPTVKIGSRIEGGKWVRKNAIYPLKGQRVSLRVKQPFGKQSQASIKWYLVFADLSQNYKNANHPWEPDAYKWIGYGKINYCRMEISSLKNKWEVSPLENKNLWQKAAASMPSFKNEFYKEDLGSFWFQVEITQGNKVTRSAGIEDVNDRGISPSVFRVSIRNEEGYLGFLSSFFNVPGIFGSVNYQTKNYIGVDCADVLMAAWSRWKRKSLKRNFNVDMLTNKFKVVAELDIGKGEEEKVKWTLNVKPGDLIAVKYFGSKRYQHIGALWSDANANGVLDGDDVVIHAGPDPLHLSPLKWGFVGHVKILRP